MEMMNTKEVFSFPTSNMGANALIDKASPYTKAIQMDANLRLGWRTL